MQRRGDGILLAEVIASRQLRAEAGYSVSTISVCAEMAGSHPSLSPLVHLILAKRTSDAKRMKSLLDGKRHTASRNCQDSFTGCFTAKTCIRLYFPRGD
jgi:hypothetical protein